MTNKDIRTFVKEDNIIAASLHATLRASSSPNTTDAPATSNVSDMADVTTGTARTLAPTATTSPAITLIYDDVGESMGALQPNDETDDLRPTLLGTGEPGRNIIITLKNENGSSILLGTTIVDAYGNWALTPSQDLPLGKHELIASQDGSGISAPWPITLVDNSITPEPQPTITAIHETFTSSSNPINKGGSTLDLTPLIEGTAKPNTVVIIKSGENIVGSTVSDASGNWKFEPTLQYGHHELIAVSFDQNGNYSQPSEAFGLTIATSGQYDFEALELKTYEGAAPTVNGINFSSVYWWWEETQVVKIGDTKAGLANTIGQITVDWPEKASQASFNIWSDNPSGSSVTIKLWRGGGLIDELKLEKMPTNPHESNVAVSLTVGTFDTVTIACTDTQFYVDNINVVRGGLLPLSETSTYSIDASEVNVLAYSEDVKSLGKQSSLLGKNDAIGSNTHNAENVEARGQLAAKEILLNDLLADGTTSIFPNQENVAEQSTASLQMADLDIKEYIAHETTVNSPLETPNSVNELLDQAFIELESGQNF